MKWGVRKLWVWGVISCVCVYHLQWMYTTMAISYLWARSSFIHIISLRCILMRQCIHGSNITQRLQSRLHTWQVSKDRWRKWMYLYSILLGYCGAHTLWLFLVGLKFCDSGSTFFTCWLVLFPMGFLTCTRTVSDAKASITIHCVAAFRHSTWKTALWVKTNTHLWYVLHFFVFIVQARAGDALPEECY